MKNSDFEMTGSERLTDAHCFFLPSQGNVYTMTTLNMLGGLNKVLVGSLRRKVFAFEYLCNSENSLKPSVKEVLFTYIPSGAEIISMDAFNKSQTSNDFVIGITIIKQSEEGSPATYLNVYSEWEPTSEFHLDSVAQNCLSLELHFVPYQLYHTELPLEEGESGHEIVWLLSGSDEEIHLFQEDRLNHCYVEQPVSSHFPEFTSTPSVVLRMDVLYVQDFSRRISVVGCECGYMRLRIVDVKKKEILNTWEKTYDGPITSLRFFVLHSHVDVPEFIKSKQASCSSPLLSDEESVHLVVGNTLEPSYVYRDVLREGLAQMAVLPMSDHYDVVLCACIADVDFDGENEILLGTYGQELLLYKLKHSSSPEDLHLWSLEWQFSLPYPLHSILYLDVTGDGLNEFIIHTQKGVHIFQHKMADIKELVTRRLRLPNMSTKDAASVEGEDDSTSLAGGTQAKED